MEKRIASIRQQANAIAAKYSRFMDPAELQGFYKELDGIGVSVGMITNRQDFQNLSVWRGSCEWYINGEQVEDSVFVMSCYEGSHFFVDSEILGRQEIIRNDYCIYFS